MAPRLAYAQRKSIAFSGHTCTRKRAATRLNAAHFPSSISFIHAPRVSFSVEVSSASYAPARAVHCGSCAEVARVVGWAFKTLSIQAKSVSELLREKKRQSTRRVDKGSRLGSTKTLVAHR